MAMETLFESILLWTTGFIFGCYLYLKFVTFNHWKKLGVPHETPLMLVGNTLPLITGKVYTGELLKNSYEKFKMHPYHGIYMYYQPHLVITDLDLIRLILVKEFSKFEDRGVYYNRKIDPLAANLFFAPPDRWKFFRTKCSPLFAPGQLKLMYPLIEKVGGILLECCEDIAQKGGIVDVREIMLSYTTDVIGSITFGLQCNSLKDSKSDFSKYSRLCFVQHPVKVSMAFFAPQLLYWLRMTLTRPDVGKYFTKVFREVLDYRKTNKIHNKDFVDLLIQLMENHRAEDDKRKRLDSKISTQGVNNNEAYTFADACSQAILFLEAGLDTSASTLSFCIYELAINTGIQDKLRLEINDVLQKESGLSNYDNIYQMSYLDKVVSETLRKYPVAPYVFRVGTQDYKLPNSDFVIPKGTRITIPTQGIHHDENIYPEPDVFNPDRFNAETVSKRHAYAYLPFGEGPKICIGKRLALLQVKVAVAKLLSRFKFSACEKTPIPMKFSHRSIAMTPTTELFLRIEELKS